MREKAIAEYHAHLAADQSLNAELFAGLDRRFGHLQKDGGQKDGGQKDGGQKDGGFSIRLRTGPLESA
jgi:hypothetical protein